MGWAVSGRLECSGDYLRYAIRHTTEKTAARIRECVFRRLSSTEPLKPEQMASLPYPGRSAAVSVGVLNQELLAAFLGTPDPLLGDMRVPKQRPVGPREPTEERVDRDHEHLEIDATSQEELELA